MSVGGGGGVQLGTGVDSGRGGWRVERPRWRVCLHMCVRVCVFGGRGGSRMMRQGTVAQGWEADVAGRLPHACML